MDIFNLFSNIFDKDSSGQKEVNEQRKQTKEKLKTQLKEQLFMSKEEIDIIISIIEEYEQKRDKIQEDFDPENHSTEQAELMDKKLSLLQAEMETSIKDAIKTIMQEKLRLAKEMKKRQEGNK